MKKQQYSRGREETKIIAKYKKELDIYARLIENKDIQYMFAELKELIRRLKNQHTWEHPRNGVAEEMKSNSVQSAEGNLTVDGGTVVVFANESAENYSLRMENIKGHIQQLELIIGMAEKKVSEAEKYLGLDELSKQNSEQSKL